MRKTFVALLALTGVMGLTACDDSDDFTTRPPRFNAFSITKLKAATGAVDDGVFRVGDVLLATLVQSEQGHLLNKVTYQWSTEPSATHKYTQVSVYDANPESPTDTITLTQAGFHTLTLSARYSVSGNAVNMTWTSDHFADQGSATLAGSLLNINLSATQTFTVEEALTE